MNRRAFFGAATLALTPVATATTQIALMFDEWSKLYDSGYDRNLTDAAANSIYERYAALKDKIVSSTPETARDVAIQFYVDTDAFGSDFSDEFSDKVQSLIAA